MNSSKVEALKDTHHVLPEVTITPILSHKTRESGGSVTAIEHGARAGIKAEHELTIRDALYKWPKAILWAIVFGSATIMEGYDMALIGAFWGYPTFQEKYGSPYRVKSGAKAGEIAYQVRAAWQSGTQAGVQVACMIGVIIGGTLCQRWGYRRVFTGSLIVIAILLCGPFFSNDMQALCASEFLLGIPWGIISSLGPAYSSEIAPVALRAYLATYVNVCWVIGQLIASGLLRGLLNRPDQWSYRLPFAVQWCWPVPILVAVLLAPESPWHLVRCGKLDEARAALKRTCREDRGVNIDDHLAMLIQTNKLEKEISAGTSYLDCFRGVDLRRTEIACMSWAVQQLSGSPFAGQAVYFFTIAGLSGNTSFSLGIGTYALGLVGTVLSWFLMMHFGRRTIYLFGTIAMCMAMLCIGAAAIPAGDGQNKAALYTQAGLMIGFVFIYDLTVGPIAFSVVSEISSTRLRAKTVGLARCFYNLLGVIALVGQPYLINPTAANLQGKVAFIWAVLCGASVIWVYFRLPEPKGRTYAELDILFEKEVPARQFSSSHDILDSSWGQLEKPAKAG